MEDCDTKTNRQIALMLATGNRDIKALTPTEGSRVDANGKTALMIAAWKGHAEALKAHVLTEGDETTADGQIALMIARMNKNSDAVKLLAPIEGAGGQKEPTSILVEQSLQCRVCRNMLQDPVSLTRCGHTFCEGCAHQLRQNSRVVCALCKKKSDMYIPAYVLRDVIHNLSSGKPREVEDSSETDI